MKVDKVFKRYDVRGEYPEELDEQFMELMGKALGTFTQENFGSKIVVGRDNKETSIPLKDSLLKGLKSTGVTVLDAGVGPTDYTAFHGSENDAVSAQVTSSHMPLEFNGLKLMYPEGNGFVNEDLNQLKEVFRDRSFSEGTGEIKELENPEEEYKSQLLEFAQSHIDITDRKIVLDTLGGAATDFLPELLEELGFQVVNIADEKEKHPYYDPPNPKPEILDHIPERVDEEEADMALAVDMDADRVAAYYNGEWISGDDLFCIFAQIFEGEAVASIDTSKNLEKFTDNVYYTRVGDPFVIDKMIEEDAVLSGEPNGHYCFPKFVNYNSGTLAACLLAGQDLTALMERIPEKALSKINIETEEKGRVMEKTEKKVKENHKVLSDKDGVKFELDQSTVLVRPSGSSPVIRVKSEAGDPKEAQRAAKETEKMIRENI